MAFTPADCAESYVADGLPIDARPETILPYFVEPGGLGSPLTCTVIAATDSGAILQVSEPIEDNPHAAFVQYFPDGIRILRTEGEGAGQSLSSCGAIADDLPPERNPGGFGCRIDISLGRGVFFDLEYGPDGRLAWLNFEVSAHARGILENSTIVPILHDIAPDELRAGVILSASDTTFVLRYAPAAGVFRTIEPEAMLDLFFAQREAPQNMSIVIEAGDAQTGPYAQADFPAIVVEEIMAELELLERLIRAQRGLL